MQLVKPLWAAGLLLALLAVMQRPSVRAEDAADTDVFARDTLAGLLTAEHAGRFWGARSCAAAACHGGVRPDARFPRSRRNEYVVWLDRDPHQRAYQTLDNELSRRILERLDIRRDGELTDAEGMANCLACHNPQPPAARQHLTYFPRDAVSCETCHGPAEKWIGQHVAERVPPGPRAGIIDTKNLLVRARLCAACHVGSPGRDVNHDLIAAGHPPLKFEMAAYHDQLPKHWRDRQERSARPNFEKQLWAAGQVAAAEAALTLLSWRAGQAVEGKPQAVWPEFAEYNCYACHHDLVHESWRQEVAADDRPPGMAAWGSWYFGALRRLLRDTPVDPRLGELTTTMQRGFGVAPPQAARAADGAQQALAEWLAATQPESLLAAADSPAGAVDLPARQPGNWDEATQLFLLLAALDQARDDARRPVDREVSEGLARLRRQLAFPDGYDSPATLFHAPRGGISRGEMSRILNDLIQRAAAAAD